MCGIAGYVLNGSQAEAAVVRNMCAQIVHRGPDDEGIHVDGGCGIGMRRLSIIDLGSGHQPIANEDGTVWVVFNGEIYNYRELRGWLEGRGHRFRTASDTETLLHLWEEEGVDGIARLRGMFAYAIWDARTRQLMLARDRFGKKPLYYAASDQGLWFASEIKCLRAAGVPLTVDEEALKLYFQFTYIPDPWTAFREVRKLPPGSWLISGPDGAVRQGRYWTPPVPGAAPETITDDEEACRAIRSSVEDAVRARLVADVPLGAFLSGGIDSSIVVGCMARLSPDPVKTFSIGFEEAAFNELHWAGAMARHSRTDHHQIVVRPDSASLVDRLVRHFDEPFGDSSAIPTFIVSEFAARHVKVALSGDGGDELFAGYTRFRLGLDRARFDRFPLQLRAAGGWIADRLPYSTYGRNYLRMLTRRTALERYFEEITVPRYLRQELLQTQWMLPEGEAFLRTLFDGALLPDQAGLLAQMLYYETAVNLPGDMLVKVDRMSMANSLEVRCPLLDAEVAEVAARIPNEMKMAGGRPKALLLRAFADLLPPELLDRPKMGFGVPLADWFRGPLRPMLWDSLTGRRFLDRGFVRPAFMRTLLEEHQSGRRDNYLWLWSLLVLERWFEIVEEVPTAGAAA